jgi:hypothetical protein
MIADLAIEIAKLALSVAESFTQETAPEAAAVTTTLLFIIKKSVEAYLKHTDKTPDPSLIKPEQPV